MGWTNSHLHSFCIRDELYGDPLLLQQNFHEMDFEDSTTTRPTRSSQSQTNPSGLITNMTFVTAGNTACYSKAVCVPVKGTRYPTCLEGERACPPEDVGGVRGYQGAPHYIQ